MRPHNAACALAHLFLFLRSAFANTIDTCVFAETGDVIFEEAVYDAATVFHGKVLDLYKLPSALITNDGKTGGTTIKYFVKMQIICVFRTNERAPELPVNVTLESKCPFTHLNLHGEFIVAHKYFASLKMLEKIGGGDMVPSEGEDKQTYLSEERNVFNATKDRLGLVANVCGMVNVVPLDASVSNVRRKRNNARLATPRIAQCPDVSVTKDTCINPRASRSGSSGLIIQLPVIILLAAFGALFVNL
ncbi:uncharacterized protein LOC106157306 [Lingula anatina]|uniref:Uncharacterized protein LOC106157306 n=1 Tax=Lingula anatina TaxID=7574 RepID=A0A1S3HS52_LINAN|nr:uncharacterized protein LOC106157306 [Lingula anatina]XP_013388375.1 uncharacterized protein LOC106157306 [Lingula anatina]XP_013388376.1 uncharacterized protein LOC106157306 [Lingula anatina]XP_013388377.1 uncharacterized protein LOC106157306 [Lingula anatina]XP_013388378.1 uncharacterized protein LOC106157306 [Lingula anatina]XP_013388379.1 uncharacterized protein LOC106157306 [Lingula anatina]XP_013388380.1 uncharacterized protein LOC106157306 [Lingula anatina]|eukprot:XP_013388373.1 uncharacterized protein LOC106157306 [Lingula anatina]